MSVEILSTPEIVDLKLQLLDRLIRLREVVGDTAYGRFVGERATILIHSIERELLLDNATTEGEVNVGNLMVKVTAETTPEFDELLKKIGEHTSTSGELIAEALENLKIKVAED